VYNNAQEKKGGMKYASEARKQDVAKPREKKTRGTFCNRDKEIFSIRICLIK